MTMRVLIFDDDAAICRLVVKVATMSGLSATAVSDATAFAHNIQQDPPEVVLLDLQLGITDGVEQMRALADRQYAGALVLMSGYDARVLSTSAAVGRSLGLKIEGVLEKPLTVAALERMFERLQSMGQSLSNERLREAIVNDELALDFQPVVTREPKVLKKLEALIRWDHPVLGRIPPGDFLPMAEGDTATIDALTDWVIGAVVEAYQVLEELGVSVALAVNISPRNLHDLTLPERIWKRLQAGGMPAEHLCLEITETAAFTDVSRTMDILSRMRLKGSQLSIDDFGTGYSSLKMLRQMPFSEIKIDQSFVADVTTSRDSRAIVKSIIDLAANMDMTCVAEGVETLETAALLEELGVATLQGYLIARPMPIEAVPTWLAIWKQSRSGIPADLAMSPIQTEEVRREHGTVSDGTSVAVLEQEKGAAAQLSPRQLEVMKLLAQGCPLKVIAFRLNLGISTVKVHVSLAYSALGAHNRVDAIRKAGPALLGT